MPNSNIAVANPIVRESSAPPIKPIKEDTRHRLLKAAQKLFSKNGFESTTVKELSDEAGVNVSLVSYHFGGKENLYRACLEQFTKERLAATQRLLQTPHSREELRVRLRMFIEEFATTHIENSQTCQMIHRECEKPDSIAEDIFKETFMKLFQTLVRF
jgi:AcrR family transcriptional regulator